VQDITGGMHYWSCRIMLSVCLDAIMTPGCNACRCHSICLLLPQ
jgi:hypothetical protein